MALGLVEQLKLALQMMGVPPHVVNRLFGGRITVNIQVARQAAGRVLGFYRKVGQEFVNSGDHTLEGLLAALDAIIGGDVPDFPFLSKNKRVQTSPGDEGTGKKTLAVKRKWNPAVNHSQVDIGVQATMPKICKQKEPSRVVREIPEGEGVLSEATLDSEPHATPRPARKFASPSPRSRRASPKPQKTAGDKSGSETPVKTPKKKRRRSLGTIIEEVTNGALAKKAKKSVKRTPSASLGAPPKESVTPEETPVQTDKPVKKKSLQLLWEQHLKEDLTPQDTSTQTDKPVRKIPSAAVGSPPKEDVSPQDTPTQAGAPEVPASDHSAEGSPTARPMRVTRSKTKTLKTRHSREKSSSESPQKKIPVSMYSTRMSIEGLAAKRARSKVGGRPPSKARPSASKSLPPGVASSSKLQGESLPHWAGVALQQDTGDTSTTSPDPYSQSGNGNTSDEDYKPTTQSPSSSEDEGGSPQPKGKGKGVGKRSSH